MPQPIRRRERRGATAIEYVLLAAMFAVVVLIGIQAFATAAVNMFDYVATTISAAS